MNASTKPGVALELLRDSTVFVHFDPRRADVVVPKSLGTEVFVTLQFGMNMAVPIPDLRVDNDCISGTLLFGRTKVFCSIPWAAVFALTSDDKRGMFWAGDAPAEVIREQKALAEKHAAEKKRPALRLVK